MTNTLSRVGDKLRQVSRSRVTAAIVGGALVVLLSGGTAVAASKITGDDIQHYTLTKQHLKRDSVGSWETVNRSLTGGDIRLDSIGQRVFTPPLRERINQPALPGYEVIGPEQRFEVGTHTMTVDCPDGKQALSGGHEASADGANGQNVTVQQSQPAGLTEQADGTWQATGWQVRFTVTDSASQNQANMKVFAVCGATS
ncbi:MAG: hypothetical protein GEV04_22750 [Actinophytocola sp.]|nr:hypothetical protein [Actinophytocola sp.]